MKKGDRVCLYMQMIPELPIAMLACARIGAIHSVVFGAFSEDSLRDRIQDSECKIVITQDTALRGNKNDIEMKTKADTAVAQCPSIKNMVVVKRTGLDVPMQAGRDVWWHEAMGKADAKCEPVWLDAEDPLFILYTSGSTGKPKGVLHTTGGYMVFAATTFKYIFDYKDGDIWWCTADIGWITGHSYIVYGPLCTGRDQRDVRGRADVSRRGSLLGRGRQVQGHSVLHRADRHSRADAAWRGADQQAQPVQPQAARVGRRADQSRSVAVVLAAHRQGTLPGRRHLVADGDGRHSDHAAARCPHAQAGQCQPSVLWRRAGRGGRSRSARNRAARPASCASRSPWPGIMRTTWGDHERFVQTYFSTFKGLYFSGDGCRVDEDGDYWLLGRVDDVINVSGHRLGTAEVESALVSHPAVAEAAVVGCPHEIKGQGIYAYVTLRVGQEPSDALLKELIKHVRKEIGPIATPDVIQWAPGLPKTRSGKIMRRILRKIAENETDKVGDTSTLADPSVVEDLIRNRPQR